MIERTLTGMLMIIVVVIFTVYVIPVMIKIYNADKGSTIDSNINRLHKKRIIITNMVKKLANKKGGLKI